MELLVNDIVHFKNLFQFEIHRMMDSTPKKTRKYALKNQVVLNETFVQMFEKCRNSDSLMGGNIMSKIKTQNFGVVLKAYDMTNTVMSIKLSLFSPLLQIKLFIARRVKMKEPNKIRIFFRNFELTDSAKTLTQYGIKNRSMIFYIPKTPMKKRQSLAKPSKKNAGVVRFFGCVPKNSKTKKLLSEVKKGLKMGFVPELALNGTGGTYFLKDKMKKKCAVFKPADEEAYAPNNPRIYKSEFGSPSLRPGLFSGGGANREVAAFLLDKGNYCGIPVTTMVEFKNYAGFNYNNVLAYQKDKKHYSKIGSLQKLIDRCENAADYGTRRFGVEDVHKIGILDLHIVNLDRNDENILVKSKPNSKILDFIPIDHGYCLPTSLAINYYDWVWVDWPQSQKPFNKASLKFIESINIEKDIVMLKSLGIEEEAILVFSIVNTLLKKAARAGLTLHQIAKIVVRAHKDKPSKLETIVITSLALYLKTENKKEDLKSRHPRSASKSIPVKSFHGSKNRISKSFSEPKRSKSRINLNRDGNIHSENCFHSAKCFIFPQKKDWRQNSGLDVPERFGEKRWQSDYAELLANSSFFAGAESLMDFAIYGAVLSNRKAARVDL